MNQKQFVMNSEYLNTRGHLGQVAFGEIYLLFFVPLMSWKTGDLLHNLFIRSVSYFYSCVTTTNKAQNYGVSALFLSDFFT